MHFLVTGGLGYIGAHTVIQLYEEGHTVEIIDNCENSDIKTIGKLCKITNCDIIFHKVDIRDFKKLLVLVYNSKPDSIIHFADLKNVGESMAYPFEYYENNLIGLLNILRVAKELNCPNFIFSSSCTVYPHNAQRPLTEHIKAAASNQVYDTIVTGSSPYGTSKLMCEQILHDMVRADPFWNITILRYFNPVGNHKSHLIGDDFLIENKSMNLFTAILNKQLYKKPVEIFGDKYPTHDGTAVRDYIHVLDVATAHIKAAQYLKKGLEVFNIGTGKGYSVLEIINKFNNCGFKIEYKIVEERKGDVAEVYADCTKTKNILKWEPKYLLEDMVQDSVQYFLYKVKNI